MRGGTEAVEADRPSLGGHPVGAVADQPRAEERRGLRIGVARGDREAEAFVGDGEEFLEFAPRVPIKTEVEVFPLAQANEALDRLRRGEVRGAAVLVP